MPKNYEKERSLKVNKKNNLLGKWWFLLFLWCVWIAMMTLITNYLTTVLRAVMGWGHAYGYQLISGQMGDLTSLKQGFALINLHNYAVFSVAPLIYLIILGILAIIPVRQFARLWYKNRDTNKHQYGNDRLTTEHEVLTQYRQIPDRGKSFKGYGGIPVHHITPSAAAFVKSHPVMYFSDYLVPKIAKNRSRLEPAHGFYAIDQTTVNSLIVGITRSGKGETLIMPLVDILSRAAEKCSIVANDPKGELYQMSYETLRKRGYNVQVLNVQQTDFSMSYNPLQNIIDYAKEGYFDEVQQEVNTLSSSIYVDPNAKDKFWQNSSINLLNSLILAIIDYAKRNNAWESVTMDNVVHMMTNLGSQTVGVNQDGDMVPTQAEIEQGLYAPDDPAIQPVEQKPKLILYFEQLSKLNQESYSKFREMALDAFAQSKFAGDETSGNIYSSAMEGIKIYQQSNIAKLTSLNSVNFESIGFPRMFKIKLPKAYRFHTGIVEFLTTDGKSIESRKQIVDNIGMLTYGVKAKLPDQFRIKISFDFKKNPVDIQNDAVELEGSKQYTRLGFGKQRVFKDPYTHKPVVKDVKLKITNYDLQGDITEMKLDYSESPVALFLVTPPNNPSYNQLPAFAVDQIFNTIYGAALKNGRKAFTRVHFLLDEFGNLPTIANMDTKVSIGLGQNLLFDIVVQNLEQLKIKYTADQAATIQSNCANLLYILTESNDTAKQISEKIGKQTVRVDTQSGQAAKVGSVNVSSQYISQDILAPTELMKLMGGEMVVLRSVYRQDQKGHAVSAMPIFDHGMSNMPFRNTFLKKEFNDASTLSDIGIKALHQTLDLKTLRINFDVAYDQVAGRNGLDPFIQIVKDNQESETGVKTSSSEQVETETKYADYTHPDTADVHEPGTKLPTRAVFSEKELTNPQLLTKAVLALGSGLDQLSPDTKAAVVGQYLFDDMANWWLHDRHNDWAVVENMLDHVEGLIDGFHTDLDKLKQEEGLE